MVAVRNSLYSGPAGTAPLDGPQDITAVRITTEAYICRQAWLNFQAESGYAAIFADKTTHKPGKPQLRGVKKTRRSQYPLYNGIRWANRPPN